MQSARGEGGLLLLAVGRDQRGRRAWQRSEDKAWEKSLSGGRLGLARLLVMPKCVRMCQTPEAGEKFCLSNYSWHFEDTDWQREVGNVSWAPSTFTQALFLLEKRTGGLFIGAAFLEGSVDLERVPLNQKWGTMKWALESKQLSARLHRFHIHPSWVCRLEPALFTHAKALVVHCNWISHLLVWFLYFDSGWSQHKEWSYVTPFTIQTMLKVLYYWPQ